MQKKSKMKFESLNQKQVRLAHRVEHVVTIIGFQEFTPANVARALAVDVYDIIFALHHLRNEGRMERLTNREDVQTDLWRRRIAGRKYKAERTKVVPLTERA
jgi:hypothetical protein